MRSIFVFLLVFAFNFSYTQSSIKELDQHFEKSLDFWNVPGMSIGIIKDGKVVLAEGYGVIEEGKKPKVDSETMYAIASNTKAFTTAALAILVESGKIKWSDKVRKYLPGFSIHGPYESENLVIRDLLCHRVGYSNYSGDVMWYKSKRPASEMLKNIQHVPKAYEFRDGYGYTNLMFMTAGEVISAVTGQSWHAYINEIFISPLGMDRTVTKTSELSNYKNVATPHKSPTGGNTAIDWTDWDNMGAAGSIISNVDDMLKWIQLHLNHGKKGSKEYFTQGSQETMWKVYNSHRVDHNTRKRFPRSFAGYGLGWAINDHMGHKVVSHGGGYDGMYSRVAMVPDQNLGIVILTNSMTGISSSLTYEILDYYLNGGNTDWNKSGMESQKRYLGSIEGRKQEIKDRRVTGTSPSVSSADLAGIYYDGLYGDNIYIKAAPNGDLTLHFDKAPELSAHLTHWHYDTYQIEWDEIHAWFDFGTIQFTKNNDNEVAGIEFDVPNGDIFFHEIHAKRVDE